MCIVVFFCNLCFIIIIGYVCVLMFVCNFRNPLLYNVPIIIYKRGRWMNRFLISAVSYDCKIIKLISFCLFACIICEIGWFRFESHSDYTFGLCVCMCFCFYYTSFPVSGRFGGGKSWPLASRAYYFFPQCLRSFCGLILYIYSVCIYLNSEEDFSMVYLCVFVYDCYGL